MLEVHFIENFPVGNRIVITRLVLLSVLVLKSTFGVPSQESCIVVRNFLELRDATFQEVADYYARLLAWYTKGGFKDEYGKQHESVYHYSIPYWDVINQ